VKSFVLGQRKRVSNAIVLLLLESLDKGTRLCNPHQTPRLPEDTAGLFSRSFLLWLIPFSLQGYHSSLSAADLYPVGGGLAASGLTERLHVAWSNTNIRNRQRLGLALSRAFFSQLLLVQIPRLALVGFAIAQPFLV
jgi:hypothetical protein